MYMQAEFYQTKRESGICDNLCLAYTERELASHLRAASVGMKSRLD